MSKFDRHKKSTEPYVYPHKHCGRCGQMIEESLKYCPVCYQFIKQRKRKKRFRRGKEEIETPKIKVRPSKVSINFEKQRFCPKCGKIININLYKCNFCEVPLDKIKPIGTSDEILKKLALSALKDPNVKVRKEAVDTLGNFEESKTLGVLTYVMLNDADKHVRKAAADEIGDMHNVYSIDALKKALKDEDPKVRDEAREGLRKIREHTQKTAKPKETDVAIKPSEKQKEIEELEKDSWKEKI